MDGDPGAHTRLSDLGSAILSRTPLAGAGLWAPPAGSSPRGAPVTPAAVAP